MAREESDPNDENQALYQFTAANVGPIKWMAPEQLDELKYSKGSDVWSFGVLMYEIYARQMPWKGVPNTKIPVFIHLGKRLELPATTPADVVELVNQCWAEKARDRPPMIKCARVLRDA